MSAYHVAIRNSVQHRDQTRVNSERECQTNIQEKASASLERERTFAGLELARFLRFRRDERRIPASSPAVNTG